MPTLFEVESSDINDLNDLNLTKLLKLLLHLEAKSAGISERAIEVALNITVADGGEDGRIEWSDGPDATAFLPSRLVQFQNKATNMRATACANEIVKNDGTIKPMIEQALVNVGSYILFTTQELNNQQKQERINAIRQKLRDIEKPYAETTIIDVYDATKIQGWVNRYMPAIVAVSNWVGRPIENGIITWEEWEKFKDNQEFDFIADDAREDAINGLRSLLSDKKRSARIIGLSGLGKTRLALEVCRDTSEIDYFSKRVAYIDSEYIQNLPGLLISWVRKGLEGLIVVDNCDLSLHKALKRVIEHQDSNLSLLTVHFDPEKDSDTETVLIKQMDDQYIKIMLEPLYGEKLPDLDRIIGFAQGFPLMAVLLARARLEQAGDIGSLTDDDLLMKMLWGRENENTESVKILRATSLFDKFGFEQEVVEESKFISDKIACIDEDTYFECIKTFQARGIVNRAGRFAQIVPKPLAIRLAADWWRNTRPERQKELIESDMPGQLVDSFCEQLSKLDFLPEVKDFTKDLCGEQAPFGQAEVILSDKGSSLFRALVEVNPVATSDALYKIFKSLSLDDLSNISGDIRRNLVWALEKLCFRKEAFDKSALCLMWLAAAENENWSNNATGQFVQLFRIFLSGTEAEPDQRLQIIDEALESEELKIRELAIKALDSSLDSYGGTRTVGAEYQGSGEPLVEWRPKIWQEAFDYWENSINRLLAIALSHSELSEQAKVSIASNIRNLMQYGRVELLDKTIHKIVESDGPLWPKALDSIKNTLSYGSEKMPDEGVEKLNEWHSLLMPESLQDRITLLVSIPSFEHEEDENGNLTDLAAKNAEDFAKEFSDDFTVLLPYLEQLLIGEQRQGYRFGLNLVLNSGEWEPFLSESILLLKKLEDPNISFLLGLLNGVYKVNPEKWEEFINHFSEDTILAKYYSDFLITGLVKSSHLTRLIELIKQGLTDVASATVFTYGRSLEHLSPIEASTFVDELREISEEAAWVSLDILSMYCHGSKEKWDDCKDSFKKILLNLPLNKGQRTKQSDIYHWQSATEKVLNDIDEDFAKGLTKRIISSFDEKIDFGDIDHSIKPIMRILLNKYGESVWPIVSDGIRNAEKKNKFYLTHLLSKQDGFAIKETSILADLSEEIFQEWCMSEPDLAPHIVARESDVFIDEEEGCHLSPRVKFIIDNFGDNKDILSELSANMGSFGWSGSVVPYYEKEINAIEPLLQHEISTVREWVDRRISYLKKQIDKETMLDEETEWGIR